MKKYLFLSLVFSGAIATTTLAQTGSGPSATATPTSQATKDADMAAALQQAKEKLVPQMVAKTGLTEAQANKVIELNWAMRQAAGALRDMSETDRSAKIAELKADKEKKMKELLTAEQIQAVKTFYEDMGKNAQRSGS